MKTLTLTKEELDVLSIALGNYSKVLEQKIQRDLCCFKETSATEERYELCHKLWEKTTLMLFNRN